MGNCSLVVAFSWHRISSVVFRVFRLNRSETLSSAASSISKIVDGMKNLIAFADSAEFLYIYMYVRNLQIYNLTEHIYKNDTIESMIGIATLNEL